MSTSIWVLRPEKADQILYLGSFQMRSFIIKGSM
ncbi:MAG: hypothetical protein JWM94_913, partial [Sphingomonas bacterium]|nr:hypothetical protein [Sphingomonas bacterium]